MNKLLIPASNLSGFVPDCVGDLIAGVLPSCHLKLFVFIGTVCIINSFRFRLQWISKQTEMDHIHLCTLKEQNPEYELCRKCSFFFFF